MFHVEHSAGISLVNLFHVEHKYWCKESIIVPRGTSSDVFWCINVPRGTNFIPKTLLLRKIVPRGTFENRIL
jgi:hypothetical protein